MLLVIILFPLGSVDTDHAAAAHANAIVASTPTISCSQTHAAIGAELIGVELIGVGVAVCHARVHARTPRCCRSASPSRELPGAPASARSRNCS
jgi:hypothetical protein